MYYDAHTHLNEDRLFPDWQKHLQAFFDLGGKGVTNVGDAGVRNQRAVEIAQQSLDKRGDAYYVKATIGIHPGEVSFGKITTSKQIAKHVDDLRYIYENNTSHVVAIGECGMDAHYEWYEKHKWLQQELFDAQCKLAQELRLPIVIHSRDQFEDTYEIIKHYTGLDVYYHCRGYGPEQLEKLHQLLPKFRFGCCGNITYPNAQQLRDSLLKWVELAKTTGPIENPNRHMIHFLLETDAPYLSPQSKRGQLNTPSTLVDIYSYASQLTNLPLETLQNLVQQSFSGLFMR